MHKRLGRLAAIEAVNVVLVPAFVLYMFGRNDAAPSWLVMACVGCVSVSLAAGSVVLWRRSRGHLSYRLAHLLARTFVSIGVLSSAMLVLALVAPWFGMSWPQALAAAGLALFACAEVLNYRWVQISAGGWKAWFRGRIVRPILLRELTRSRRLANQVRASA